MYLKSLMRTTVLLVAVGVSFPAAAQQNADGQFKEVQLAANAFSLATPVPTWVDPVAIPDDNDLRPIVVRLADTQVLVDRVPVAYVRRATLINDAASLTSAGRFSISFTPDYERVQLHSILIHRGQDRLDRTTTSPVRFLQREQGLERDVYSGYVTASILIDDLRVGDTLDISYSTSGQNPVFGGKYTGFAGWDQSYPTILRRVVLNHPIDRQIAWRMIGDRPAQAVAPTVSTLNGIRKIEFVERSLPETISEPQTFTDFFAFRFLQFSEFASWSDVASWAGTLFHNSSPIGDDLQQVVKRIRALESTEARVSAALEFVQSEIRYFSVSLGESSHRPAPPDIVFRRRYGDCKDKSFLLITLLGEMGIQSSPVLLQSGRRTGLEKTLPSSQFFDHAIVQVLVDGKTYFLDPTRLGQHGLLDRLGQAHEGVQVLVVAPATRYLSTISTNNIADLTFEEAQEHATLAKFDDDAELQTKRVWNGVTAEYLRVASESSREPFLRWIGNALERRYPGAKLSNEPTISDDRIRNTFSITANYKVPKLAADRNGNWIVYLRPDIFENVVLASSATARKTPLRVAAYPYKGKYTFDMAFPEEVSVISDPHTENVANKYFIANSSTYFRGNNAKVTADIETLASHVDPADYQKYAEDLQTANRVLGAVLYVNRLGIKSKEVSAKTDLRQRLRDARQEAIDKITETIKSGKLAGADLAETYCARGGAFSDLQRHDEALQDANEAIRLAPNSANVFACRAFFYFNAGLFDKSVADYSKAVSFGATDFEVFRMRGMARLYAGRLEDAQSDLQKATGTKDKENKIYFDLWLVTTTARLGQPVPEELLKRASMEAHGDWPRPALAMLTGAISPDDLLKRMDEKKGDERDMALAEGYFYLGQHYLNVGDKQTARTYFQKVRELEIIIYLEHVAAGFELQRLMDVNSAAQQPTNKRAVAQ